MILRALLLVALAVCVPVTAHAVTVRDIIELSKAGLSDEVLIALIDADRTIFTLDTEQILDLKHAGVGEKVLLKMLATRREFEPAPGADVRIEQPSNGQIASQPHVVVIGGPPAPPTSVTVVVPQFVPFPIFGTLDPHVRRGNVIPVFVDDDRGFGRFRNDGWSSPHTSRGPNWSMPPMNPLPRP
jgi:hypothetical protein